VHEYTKVMPYIYIYMFSAIKVGKYVGTYCYCVLSVLANAHVTWFPLLGTKIARHI